MSAGQHGLHIGIHVGLAFCILFARVRLNVDCCDSQDDVGATLECLPGAEDARPNGHASSSPPVPQQSTAGTKKKRHRMPKEKEKEVGDGRKIASSQPNIVCCQTVDCYLVSNFNISMNPTLTDRCRDLQAD